MVFPPIVTNLSSFPQNYLSKILYLRYSLSDYMSFSAMNGNGNYTPLRVYHNGMGKRGQFRY